MMERATATAFERTAEPTATVTLADASIATLPKPKNHADYDSLEQEPKRVFTKNESMAALLPPLDLRVLERKESVSTSSSSSAPLDESEASSSDELDDEEDVRTYAAEGEEFLVKPMSLLPVCPFDDLAVEEEKRRRRSARLMKKDKTNRTHCPDAESLPSPTSQRKPKPRRFTTSQVASGSDVARSPLSAPTLRRDSMAIRQQYWKQLGLSMSRRDLERNTGKRRERHVGLKVQLNDAHAQKGETKSLFQIIASWYASDDDDKDTKENLAAVSDSDSTTDSSLSPRRKGIRFNEEAELFYIPLHRDYSKRQRDCMWHTRHEFISMVERNLEAVYDEMEREYEEQCHAEELENEAMAKEEGRQRLYEALVQARAAEAAEAAAAVVRASPPQQRNTAASPVSSPPVLALCPSQITVTPRARSPHDLRFKYLKHLGINNN